MARPGPENVWLVLHRHRSSAFVAGHSDKIVGVFSTHSLAEEAVEESKGLEGFRDQADGFEIISLPTEAVIDGLRIQD